jgi:hypothetical protein
VPSVVLYALLVVLELAVLAALPKFCPACYTRHFCEQRRSGVAVGGAANGKAETLQAARNITTATYSRSVPASLYVCCISSLAGRISGRTDLPYLSRICHHLTRHCCTPLHAQRAAYAGGLLFRHSQHYRRCAATLPCANRLSDSMPLRWFMPRRCYHRFGQRADGSAYCPLTSHTALRRLTLAVYYARGFGVRAGTDGGAGPSAGALRRDSKAPYQQLLDAFRGVASLSPACATRVLSRFSIPITSPKWDDDR